MAQPFLAQITMVGFNFAPVNWALCDGTLLPINQNQALFALLGTTYGGDGIQTFALPDLRGRAPLHTDGSAYALGTAAGETSHTLLPTELPVHSHLVRALDTRAQSNGPGNRLWAARLAPFVYSSNAPDTTMNPAAVGPPVGGNLPHENMQPSLVINFIIALAGIFPSRS